MTEVIVPQPGQDVMLGNHVHVHHRPHGRASILTVHSAHPLRERTIQVLERLSCGNDHDLLPAVSCVHGRLPGVYVHAGDSLQLEGLLHAVALNLPTA